MLGILRRVVPPVGSLETQGRFTAARKARIKMALNLVCAVLDRGPKDLAEMAVLLAIADSADKDTGEAWPSQVTIARRARQSDRNVRNVIGRLVAAGWLTVEERRRSNGSRASSLYVVNLAMLGEDRRVERVDADKRRVGSKRNDVPVASGTSFRGVPEVRSGHAPEPRSALEPSHNIEPCAAGAGSVDFGKWTPFQRSRVRLGEGVIVGGVHLLAKSEAMREAQAALDAWERARA
jgi:hypothetical protein